MFSLECFGYFDEKLELYLCISIQVSSGYDILPCFLVRIPRSPNKPKIKRDQFIYPDIFFECMWLCPFGCMNTVLCVSVQACEGMDVCAVMLACLNQYVLTRIRIKNLHFFLSCLFTLFSFPFVLLKRKMFEPL